MTEKTCQGHEIPTYSIKSSNKTAVNVSEISITTRMVGNLSCKFIYERCISVLEVAPIVARFSKES